MEIAPSKKEARAALSGGRAGVPADDTPTSLGGRLRQLRTHAGLGVRELARLIGVSPSLVSQIENDKVQPSVSTLYALVNQLDGSLDALFHTVVSAGPGEPKAPADPSRPIVLRASDREQVHLGSGVHWERLTGVSIPPVEFFLVRYEPGAQSSPEGSFQRHAGREWGYVLSGELHVAIGFDEHVVLPGDSVTYDSMVPHRLSNPGAEPVRAIWCHAAG